MTSGRILKWPIRVAAPATVVNVPAHAELLSVAFQEPDGDPHVWIATPAGRARERWYFRAVETGEFVPHDGGLAWEFVGTAHGLWHGQPYVSHVFRAREVLP